MKNTKLKQVTANLVLAVFLIVQAAPLAYATTDQEAATSAQEGVEYLENNQKDDGSVAGFGGETEWAVIAVKAAGKEPANVGSDNDLVDFLADDKPAVDAPATSVERKILAIAATGKATKNFGDYNYNEKLEEYHVDNQIGEKTLLNDDIFGVIAIKATNDADLKLMAQDGLDYMIAHQGADGGFSYTTDTCGFFFGNPNNDPSVDPCDFIIGSDSNDTAAAIIALDAAEKMALVNPNLADSKSSAVVYLLTTQNFDGGFGYDIYSDSDGSSTAWALMALNVIGESVRTEALSARNWLLSNQNPDCGFSYGAYGLNSSDTGTTSHAVIALMGSSWLLDPAPNAAEQSSCAYYDSVASQPTSEKTMPKIALASSTQPANSFAGSTQEKSEDSHKKDKQVAQASSGISSNSTPAEPQNEDQKPETNWGLYGVGLLILIGLGYFVVESLKAAGAKGAK